MAVAPTTDELIATVLGIPPEEVRDELGFQQTPEWDSVRHVELMVRLEETFGIPIGPQLVTELISAAAIRRFAAGAATSPPERRGGTLRRGLVGVVLDETRVSEVDPAGTLSYRGHSIHELAGRTCFESVAHLLLHGRLPDADELSAFRERLGRARPLPVEVVRIIAMHRAARPMTVLRIAVSALGAVNEAGTDPVDLIDSRERLLARIPTILATHHCLRSGRPAPEPGLSAGHSETLLAMLNLDHTGERRRALDNCLVVQAEHGANASTLAARVATSTEADRYAAVAAAIATFDGRLHGGASEQVITMAEQVGSPDRAAEYVRARRSAGKPVMGFGHRVYKTEDPRARHLRDTARTLAAHTGHSSTLDVLEAVRAEMAPLRRAGLDINVDFYAGAVHEQLGIPADLSVPVFVAARIAGWLAHIDEQRQANVLIRPQLRYVGDRPSPKEEGRGDAAR